MYMLTFALKVNKGIKKPVETSVKIRGTLNAIVTFVITTILIGHLHTRHAANLYFSEHLTQFKTMFLVIFIAIKRLLSSTAS